MLQIFRRHSKSVVKIFIAIFTILLMTTFGVDYFQNKPTTNVAAKVDEQEISYQQFNDRVSEIKGALRARFGNKFQNIEQFYNFSEQAINSLIEEKLLDAFFAEMGIKVGMEQVKAQIKKDIESIPGLGVANDQNLSTYLGTRRMTQQRLVNLTEKELLNESITRAFGDVSILSGTEAKKTFEADNTKFSFSYIGFLNESFLGRVHTSDMEVIREYYNRNIENYRKPKSVKYSYVEFPPEEYKDQVELSEEDFEANYQAQLDKYKLPKKIHLRQIVINKTSKPISALEKLASPEAVKDEGNNQEKTGKIEVEKRELSLTIKARLNNGEDFAKVASEVSEDLYSKDKGGDLGWLEPKNISEVIRSRALELKTGEISSIINSEDAFYIVKADEVEDEKYKPYEEVKSHIEDNLRISGAQTYAKADAYNTIDSFRETAIQTASSFADFYLSKGKKVVSNADFFPQGQGRNPDEVKITAAAIVSPEGTIDVIEIGTKIFIYYVDSVKNSYLPEIAEVADEVTEDYKHAEAKKLAQNSAQDALAKITSSIKTGILTIDALKTAAVENGVELKESEEFSRQGNRSAPFDSLEGGENIFNLTKEDALAKKVFEDENGYYVIALKNMIAPPIGEFATKKKELEKEEQEKSQNRLYKALIANLKAHSEIWIDPKVMERGK